MIERFLTCRSTGGGRCVPSSQTVEVDRPSRGREGAVPEDYCELCELPRATCIHGRPPATPAVAPRGLRPALRPVARTRKVPLTNRVERKWTPSATFRPHILRILREYAGRLEADDLMVELEVALDDVLTAGDRERSPQGGDRWQVAVRKQRKELIDEGLLVPAQPGVWELTPRGLSTDRG